MHYIRIPERFALLIYCPLQNDKKHISKFSVDSEVAFVSYGHYGGNYYVDIRNRQFDRLFRQSNEFSKIFKGVLIN